MGSVESKPRVAANVILGRDEFDSETSQSVRGQAEVAGTRITVVAAPGWWNNRPVDESTELLKQEMILSVRQCPPGPHVVLLVIDGDSIFDEKDKKNLEGHLYLLGWDVWRHVVVVFLFDESLGDTTVEQHIEAGGSAIQGLVEKCGNRYHVLYNDEKDLGLSEVPELLEKIKEMVIANKGLPHVVDEVALVETERIRMKAMERATERRMRLQRQRMELRSRMGRNHGCIDSTRIDTNRFLLVTNSSIFIVIYANHNNNLNMLSLCVPYIFCMSLIFLVQLLFSLSS